MHRAKPLPLSLLLCLALAPSARGEVITDGTLGVSTTLSGPDLTIPEALGSRHGSNLFHSFSRFNLAQGESATFTGSGDIAHVIARITGGEMSLIDGTLRSQVGSATLTLFNPAGMVVGPRAVFDVPAALHLGTADEVRLADGARFSALDTQQDATLSAAPPAAFGFVEGGGSGMLELQGGVWIEEVSEEYCFSPGDCLTWVNLVEGTTEHRLTPGAQLTLAGRQLALYGPTLGSDAGVIALAAVGSGAASVGLTTDSVERGQEGALIIGADTTLNISGDGSGELRLDADNILVSAAALYHDNAGTQDASGGITLRAEGIYLDDGALLDVHSNNDLAGGTLALLADQIDIGGAARVSSSGDGSSAAGDIRIDGGTLTLHDAGEIYSAGPVMITLDGALQMQSDARLFLSSPSAADLHIAAESLWMDEASINSDTNGVTPKGGDIYIDLRGHADLSYGAQISSNTYRLYTPAGTIHLNAASLRIAGSNWSALRRWQEAHPDEPISAVEHDPSGLHSVAGNAYSYGLSGANAGAILVHVSGDVQLLDTGTLSTTSYYAGAAGAIELHAHDLLLDNGEISSDNGASAGRFIVDTYGNVVPDPNEPLDGGSVVLDLSGELTMLGGRIGTFTSGDGRGAGIQIDASAITLDQGAEIDSASASRTQDAGDILLRSGDVQLRAASAITTSAYATTYASNAQGGNVTFELNGDLRLTGGSRVSADAIGAKAAGTIHVEAHNLYIDGLGSALATNSGAASTYRVSHIPAGAPGAIEVTLSGAARLSDGGRISSSTTPTELLSYAYFDDDGNLVSGYDTDWPAGSITLDAARLTITGTATDAGGSATPLGQDDGLASGIFTLVQHNDASTTLTGYSRPGEIQLRVGTLIIDQGGRISSENLAGLAKPDPAPLSTLRLSGQTLILGSAATITSAALGDAPASPIELRFAERIDLDHAEVTTAAVNGNGGDIFIDPVVMRLTESRITTSVSGSSGDGGDITLIADHLVLNGGFIQANTAATGASGGEVNLATRSLIPYGGLISLADPLRQPFTHGTNVIQAAAPDGVNGTITITAPNLDLAGELADLETPYLDPARLFSGGCAGRAGGQSRLAWGGRGRLPWSSGAPLLTLPRGVEAGTVSESDTRCWVVGSNDRGVAAR